MIFCACVLLIILEPVQLLGSADTSWKMLNVAEAEISTPTYVFQDPRASQRPVMATVRHADTSFFLICSRRYDRRHCDKPRLVDLLPSATVIPSISTWLVVCVPLHVAQTAMPKIKWACIWATSTSRSNKGLRC